MAFCQHCGAADLRDRFCGRCGNRADHTGGRPSAQVAGWPSWPSGDWQVLPFGAATGPPRRRGRAVGVVAAGIGLLAGAGVWMFASCGAAPAAGSWTEPATSITADVRPSGKVEDRPVGG